MYDGKQRGSIKYSSFLCVLLQQRVSGHWMTGQLWGWSLQFACQLYLQQHQTRTMMQVLSLTIITGKLNLLLFTCFFRKILSEILSVCQTVWIQIWPGILSGMISKLFAKAISRRQVNLIIGKLCLLCNFAFFFCLIFFQSQLFRKILRVSNSLNPECRAWARSNLIVKVISRCTFWTVKVQWNDNTNIPLTVSVFLELLRVSNCDQWMCVVIVNNCFKRTSLKLLAGVCPNLAGMSLIWPYLIIVQMVLVRCISRSHRPRIDFRDENLKIILSETTRPRAFIFCK